MRWLSISKSKSCWIIGLIKTPKKFNVIHVEWLSHNPESIVFGTLKKLTDNLKSEVFLVGFSGEVSIDHEKFTESSCNSEIGHDDNVLFGLKNPKHRLLVIANKFQTGFDDSLVQYMYVDKKLGGVQCVQTLSQPNRMTSDKTKIFMLDFVNEPEDIREFFQWFYQSTILEGETDPNRLYDIQREIYNFHLYANEDVNCSCEAFYGPRRDEGNLHSMFDRVVDNFNWTEDDDIQEDFR